MKILIEIWGNYKAWKEVTYTYNNESITSSTTLPLLYKTIKPDNTIVIVADTLIENEVTQLQGTQYVYEDLKNIVEQNTKLFITQTFEKYNQVSPATVSVTVTPAMGSFTHTQFLNNPDNFFAFVYNELAKIAVTIDQNTHNKIEIYLDITHGINYMTMMTYRAIKDIAAILAYFFDVTFIALNSDPYVGSGNVKLNINQIEKNQITPQLAIYKYPDNMQFLRVSLNKDIDNKEKANIGISLNHQLKSIAPCYNNFIGNIYAFIGAAYNALPIFIIYFFPDVEQLNTLINKIINLFNNFFQLNCNTNKLCIQQPVDFSPIFITLLQSFLFAELLSKKYNLTQKTQIPISSIQCLMEIFKHSKTNTSRIYRELDKINEINSKQLIKDEYIDYGQLNMNQNYKPDTNVDERNFFAHAGFGYTLIQLKKENNTIFIKPKDETIDNISRIVANNITTGI